MANVIAGNTSSGAWASGTSITVSHTTAITSTLLCFTIYTYRAAGNVTYSATYNGVAMTETRTQTLDSLKGRLSTFTLDNPASGAHNIVVTLSNAPDSGTLGAKDYGNIFSYTSAIASGSGTASSFSINTAVGSALFGGVACKPNETPAAGTGQTNIYAGAKFAVGYLDVTTANPQTFNWSWTTSDNYVSQAIIMTPSAPLGLMFS